MSGALINITVKDSTVREALARLAGIGGETLQTAALKNIGVYLVKSTQRRFAEQKAPDGTPWKPLNPEYAKGKKGTKILQEQGMRGGLLGSIVWQLRPDGQGVEVGTNKVYGAIHQFGGTIVPRTAEALVFKLNGKLVHAKKVTIPARPYLGISPDDETEMLAIVADLAEERWNHP